VAESRPEILLADDHADEVRPLLAGLPPKIEVITEHRADRVIATIEAHPDLGAVLLDLRFDGQAKQGEQVLAEIHDHDPQLPVIILTAVSDVGLALRLVHRERKAHFYFVKDQVDPDQLVKAVENAIGLHVLSVDRLRMTDRGEIVGTSAALQRTLRLAGKAAESESPVLLLGEPGTGKELFARAIHLGSARRRRGFVAVNCGAIPPELVPSELFGSVRGAFTEARDRKGYFEQAHQGTLFLDEVGELPLANQATLLRAVEYGEVQRVGGQPTRVDVRIIAAANRDLLQATHEGRFREDLYYRLGVFPIRLPPLRERKDDIPLLVNYYTAREHPGKSFSAEAHAMLAEHAWLGNIRELRSVLSRAILLADQDVVERRDLEDAIGVAGAPIASVSTEWAKRLLGGSGSWHDLKSEFSTSGGTLRAILDETIRTWRSTHSRRPTGEELAALLKTNRNHVNQILSQLEMRLRDYDG